MSIRPIRNYVVVSEVEAKALTAGGLYIPETSREEPIIKATVLGVGPGYVSETGTFIPTEVKTGDTVLFRKKRAQEVEHGGETVLILPETDILAVVEE